MHQHQQTLETTKNKERTHMDFKESTEAYIAYIKEHKANVQSAFQELFRPYFAADDDESYALAGVNSDELFKAMLKAKDLCAVHDDSKYDIDEFEDYRIHFYPTDAERQWIEEGTWDDEGRFNQAWLLHVSRNPHHPLYWADEDGNPLNDMPLAYVFEAICDWEAMAKKFGGSTPEWWRNQADKMQTCMTPATIELVDHLMDVLFPE
jgi:hypothetical protein